MENITHKEKQDRNEDNADLLSGSLIFARALSLMLGEGEGIVVELIGDMRIPGYQDSKKVIVFHSDNMIHIEPLDEHEKLEDGLILQISDLNNI